jgi:hypothetical protein
VYTLSAALTQEHHAFTQAQVLAEAAEFRSERSLSRNFKLKPQSAATQFGGGAQQYVDTFLSGKSRGREQLRSGKGF